MINKTIPPNIVDLRESPLDTHDIEMAIRDFYLSINFEEGIDIKVQCMDARNHLDSARILVSNLITEENEYVKVYSKIFHWMIENSGRVDKRINKIEEETIEKLETVETYNDTNLPNSPKIRKYINYLIKGIEHLVCYPLINSFKRFNKEEIIGEDGKKGIKDESLFVYYIFRELSSSLESLGAISAEELRTFPKRTVGSKTIHEQTHEEQSGLPSLPENLKTERGEEDSSFDNLIDEERLFDEYDDIEIINDDV